MYYILKTHLNRGENVNTVYNDDCMAVIPLFGCSLRSVCSKLEKQKEKKRKEEQKRKIASLSFNPEDEGEDEEENEEEEQDCEY